ncbi:hypothetical protein [Alicyclobacillus fastidiosus]|uniref:Uncharacterized protein n=1 Tax=Alicyclobacillus fastidiosus TaxID=392011 RepID=A0ABV5AK75_9BACL|nr:hypothetical protein [Alicyclobacillus fastidiosus]WEH09256.1 hypothetical protein PYS47_21705 [Alicyclobacillus fastidiosus]
MIINVASLVNDAIVCFGVGGTLLGVSKTKWFMAAMTFANGEKAAIVKGAEELVHTPIVKTIEAKFHHELNSAASDVKKFALSTYAQAAIQGAQKEYESLSPSEQAAAIAFVKSHMPKSAEATEKEIVAALKDAPTLAKMFEGDATFAKAKELTDLLSKASAPDVSNTTQDSPVSDGQATATAVS